MAAGHRDGGLAAAAGDERGGTSNDPPHVAVRRAPPASASAPARCCVAGLLAAGLASGLGSALAADPSASPAGDKVVLHVGWTNDPDNLNPFIGAETSSYEIWLLNYDFLTGYSLDLKPTPDLATSWETSPGRQDLDLPPARRA